MTSTSTIIEKSLAEHNQLMQEVIKDEELIETIAKVIEEIVNSYKKGGQLLNMSPALAGRSLTTEPPGKSY